MDRARSTSSVEDGATIQDLSEDELIAIFSVEGGSLGSRVLVANGDDAASWFVESRYASVITTDTLIENVHFDFSYCPARNVGRKLISVNVSDIAAMGARPRYALLSIGMPPETSIAGAKTIAAGIQEACKENGVAVFGGNTSRTSGPIVLTATIIGRVLPAEIIRRRGTQVGDVLFVTGRLGDARAGLRFVSQNGDVPSKEDPRYSLYDALIDPKPRVAAARALARSRCFHAMCDISDGLGRDVRRLLVPEGVGARLIGAALPISAALNAFAAQAGFDPHLEALQGGEDYELLFAAAPEDEEHILQVCSGAVTPVTKLGVVTAEPVIEVIMPDSSVIPLPDGFDHFAKGQA